MSDHTLLDCGLQSTIQNGFDRPVALVPQTDCIPKELRQRPQWVVWRYETREGEPKPTKIPYHAPGERASSTDATTWGTFAEAMALYAAGGFHGIGYVFSADDPYTGTDLDATCPPDRRDEIVARLNSYTERSPSGTGVHIIVQATKPGNRCKKGWFEVYDRDRFFTMTGHPVPGLPSTIEPRQAELDTVYREIFAPDPSPAGPTASPTSVITLDDHALIKKAFDAANGEKVRRLWDGDTTGYASPSEADLALASMLAFYTGPDPARLEQLIRGSKLARDKWNDRRGDQTWLQDTIAKALEGRTEFYTPSENGDHKPRAPLIDEGDPEVGAHINLDNLLTTLVEFLRRFVVFANEHQPSAVVLWIVHTYAIAAAAVTLYLVITSPEKRSGKSLLLEILALVTARPWRAILPSEAVLFRKLDKDKPTLLLDEVDAIFRDKTNAYEPIRAVLNAGYRRGTTVPRCGGEGRKVETVEFDVFGPKALAGIGDLPDTVADRSIPIRLSRKTREKAAERFRYRRAAGEAAPLKKAIAAWVSAHLDELSCDDDRTSIPPELNDRAADGWEPLLTIADLAGGDWPKRARRAAVALHAEMDVGPETDGVTLLRGIRDAFGIKQTDQMFTADLAKALMSLEDEPWSEAWSRIKDSPEALGHRLRKLLKPYGLSSVTVRRGEETRKGYRLDQFKDAFSSYLSPEAPQNRNTVTSQVPQGFARDVEPEREMEPERRQPLQDKECDGVTVSKALGEETEGFVPSDPVEVGLGNGKIQVSLPGSRERFTV